MQEKMKTLHMKIENTFLKRMSAAFKESHIHKRTDRVKTLLDEALKARGK